MCVCVCAWACVMRVFICLLLDFFPSSTGVSHVWTLYRHNMHKATRRKIKSNNRFWVFAWQASKNPLWLTSICSKRNWIQRKTQKKHTYTHPVAVAATGEEETSKIKIIINKLAIGQMSIDSVDFGIQIHFVSAFFAAKWAFQKNLSNFMLYYRRLFFQKKKNWIHPIKKIALDWLTMLWSVSLCLCVCLVFGVCYWFNLQQQQHPTV